MSIFFGTGARGGGFFQPPAPALGERSFKGTRNPNGVTDVGTG